MCAHYVYRVYDRDGCLIYIGCSKDLFARLAAHATTSWWADQACSVVAKVYPSRQIARDVERRSIANERPRWNLTGAWKSNRNWTRANYEDYVTSYQNQRETPTDYGRLHLDRVAAVYRKRFGMPLSTATFPAA